MIYLIDDKKQRQVESYHWDNEKFQKYSDIIKTIYTADELGAQFEQIKNDSRSIVLFHDSFFKSINLQGSVHELEKSFGLYLKEEGVRVVRFSGSNSNRVLKGNKAFMPVDSLYKYLETYLQNVKAYDDRFEYLLYGANPFIEKELNIKLDKALESSIKEQVNIDSTSQSIFFETDEKSLACPISNAIVETLFDEETDLELSDFVSKNLSSNRYDNIFIPLCFGSSLSDFNGLKLACHIRCSQSPNQTSNIYIYSFVGIESLLNNEYFNILRTKGVYLINYSQNAIVEAVNTKYEKLAEDALIPELKKLKLNVPSNYEDDHSIANEWGVFQIARNSNLNLDEIEGVDTSKLRSIYFKWLIAKNGLNEKLPSEQIEKQKEYSEKLPGLKIKGKIDLDKIMRR